MIKFRLFTLALTALTFPLFACPMEVDKNRSENVSALSDVAKLFEAAKNGDPDVLSAAHERGINLSTLRNKHGSSVLHFAATGGHQELIQRLLNTYEDLNIAHLNNNGESVLHLAAQGGHQELIQWLVDTYEDLNITHLNNLGASVLHYAALGGHQELIQWLLDTHEDLNISQLDNQGASVLHLAAAGGHQELIQWLLDTYKDLNITHLDNNGSSILHYAATGGHQKLIQRLISEPRGLLTNLANRFGETVLDIAVERQNTTLVNFLKRHREKTANKILFEAAKNGDLGALSTAHEHGINLSVLRNKHGSSVLHFAAAGGHQELIKRLVDSYGGDLNIAHLNNNGESVLHCAAQGGHQELIQWLVDSEDLNIAHLNNQGSSVLHYAAQEGHQELIQWLVDTYEDLNIAQLASHGQSILHAAAAGGHQELILWLVDTYKDLYIDHLDNHGQSILHLAALQGHQELIRRLTDTYETLDIAQLDNQGASILCYAARGGHQELIQWLIDTYETLDIDHLTTHNATVLHYAAQAGHQELIQWLVDTYETLDIAHLTNQDASVLHYAAMQGHQELIQWLLDTYETLNLTQLTTQGASVLHLAALRDQTTLIEWLVGEPLCPLINLIDANGRTVLDVAILRHRTTLVNFLRGQGAKTAREIHETLRQFASVVPSTRQFNHNISYIQSTSASMSGGRGSTEQPSQTSMLPSIPPRAHGTPLGSDTIAPSGNSTARISTDKRTHDSNVTPTRRTRRRVTHTIPTDTVTTNGFHPIHLTAESGHIDTVELMLDSDVRQDSTDHSSRQQPTVEPSEQRGDSLQLLAAAASSLSTDESPLPSATSEHESVPVQQKMRERNPITEETSTLELTSPALYAITNQIVPVESEEASTLIHSALQSDSPAVTEQARSILISLGFLRILIEQHRIWSGL